MAIAGNLPISDKSLLTSEPLRERRGSLSRWENEGGSVPPVQAAASNCVFGFDASAVRPTVESTVAPQRRTVSRAANGFNMAAEGTSGSQVMRQARVIRTAMANSRTDPTPVLDSARLYPLRFAPIYQYRPWGGRRLKDLLSAPLPGIGPVGEAWLLSDRDDHPSLVEDGPLKGHTIAQVMQHSAEQLLGSLHKRFSRFPLLLKFLDVGKSLSVQVHPSDVHGDLIPEGNTGKSEAWVVLEAGPRARIYAGLKPATTAEILQQAITNGTVEQHLASFAPRSGDGVFIRAGVVHSLRDVVVFEVQQNSDVTFRLYDWDHVDPETRQLRPLQVGQAMECIDWKQLPIRPVLPQVQETTPAFRESLVRCEHFNMTRIIGQVPFIVGAAGMASVLVCLAGEGHLRYAGTTYTINKGELLLLPAVVGPCFCQPHGVVTLLELSLPEA